MNIDPAHWASWAEIISVAGIILAAIFRYERRLTRRLDKQDADSAHLRDTLERQFGNNGFRLSESMKGLSQSVKRIEASAEIERARLDNHLNMHAEGN